MHTSQDNTSWGSTVSVGCGLGFILNASSGALHVKLQPHACSRSSACDELSQPHHHQPCTDAALRTHL